MATIWKWSNVQVGIQSAVGAATPITALSHANPGVATVTGSTIATGEYFRTDVEGMRQIDDRVFRGAAAGPTTLTLEGEDTTAYDALSGTANNAYEITFGTFMSTVRGLSSSGGEPDFIDVTTIHDTMRKQIPGISSAITYQMENLWDATDTALKALKAFGDQQTLVAIRLAFAGGAGPKVVFLGYVAATLLPTGNAQDVVVTPVTITMFGNPTIYST